MAAGDERQFSLLVAMLSLLVHGNRRRAMFRCPVSLTSKGLDASGRHAVQGGPWITTPSVQRLREELGSILVAVETRHVHIVSVAILRP